MSPQKKKTIAEQTYTLSLTRSELEHVRDLFGMLLPPLMEGSITVSESLAIQEKREETERVLWKKVTLLCERAGIALGDLAPDHLIGVVEQPHMSVLHIPKEGGE